MNNDSIREASGESAALRALYESYRGLLPRCKQDLLAQAFPAQLLTMPGLICFQGKTPVAALLWQEPTEGIVMAEFYCETPEATPAIIEKLLAEFLTKTASARARYFELWTPDKAHILQVLRGKSFQPLPRQLLALSRPVYSAAQWNHFRFLPLRNLNLTPVILQSIGRLLHEAYNNTNDGAFYDEYRHLHTCKAYVSRVLNSPLCDLRNSWLAWSPSANKPAGIALSYIWLKASSLYLEQLAVDPAFRGKGLGRALLSSVCSPLAKGAIKRVLLTVTSENLPAFRLCRPAQVEVLHHETAFVLKTPSLAAVDGAQTKLTESFPTAVPVQEPSTAVLQ